MVIERIKFNELTRVKCKLVLKSGISLASPCLGERRASWKSPPALQTRCTGVISNQGHCEAVCEFKRFSPSAYYLVQIVFHGLLVIS